MEEYNLFSLFKRKDTGQLHLFHAKWDDNVCRVKSPSLSICGRMSFDERESTIFRCKEEDEARRLCSEQGRVVCGTCVSNLYTDYDD